MRAHNIIKILNLDKMVVPGQLQKSSCQTLWNFMDKNLHKFTGLHDINWKLSLILTGKLLAKG